MLVMARYVLQLTPIVVFRHDEGDSAFNAVCVYVCMITQKFVWRCQWGFLGELCAGQVPSDLVVGQLVGKGPWVREFWSRLCMLTAFWHISSKYDRIGRHGNTAVYVGIDHAFVPDIEDHHVEGCTAVVEVCSQTCVLLIAW